MLALSNFYTNHWELFLVIAFCIKHFVCDYPLQAFPWMYRNKGTYGHLGGIVHALIHFVGTIVVLGFIGQVALPTTLVLATIDFVVHYHIDWAKMNLGAKLNLTPTTSEGFWILLGLDQLLHYLTYYCLILGALQ